MNVFNDAPQELGPALGGTLWGGTLYELEPGDQGPYHWHYGEEECLICVSGTPTLRTPLGERVLQPWDMAWFVRGEAGAHQVRNNSQEPARLVIFSTTSDPEVTVYPDDGKVAVFAGWSRNDMPEVKAYVESS